jgi:multidrug efflux pump subunit AcrB
LGIPLCFLGAFVVLGSTEFSINMITLFAFIVTLGMVVDDAIVVGERTYALREQGHSAMNAAIMAAKEMAVPVTFAILTTVAAFAPMFFVPGTMGKIFGLIPAVVISVLLLSLLESFFVLPAHLASTKAGSGHAPAWMYPIDLLRRATSRSLEWFTARVYRPFVRLAISARYLTVAVAIGAFALTIGTVVSGRVAFNFFPPIEGDIVKAQARLPYGSPLEDTQRVQRILESAATDALQELGNSDDLRGTYTRLGEEAPAMGPDRGEPETGSHIVAVELNLVSVDDRAFTADALAARWQALTPEVAGLESISFDAAMGPGAGAAVAVQLEHEDAAVLAAASQGVTEILGEYTELKNVRNGWAEGKPQLDFHLRPQARALGLTSNEVARQIRASFLGAEALREQRDRNEVKIVVRLPKDQRVSEHAIDALRIRTPQGGWVPLPYVATYERGRAATSIEREDGKRQVTVSAELAPGVESSREVLDDLEASAFDELREQFPGLTIDLVGQQREQKETFLALGQNYVFALFVIFALLAIPFRSYIQPVIVMSVIPFGFIGAVAGHALMGHGLSIMSMFGIVALSGVVVNDSLVLIDATNRIRATGKSALEAITEGGSMRLRAILLTSLTTFFGLAPMIGETSVQAQFLIPMAISLGFGVLFATVITLVVVPALYMIVEDLRPRPRA